MEAIIEKEIEERIELVSLCVFVHGWCCFGLSTFSIRPWTDANNPGEPGGCRRTVATWRAFTDEPLHYH